METDHGHNDPIIGTADTLIEAADDAPASGWQRRALLGRATQAVAVGALAGWLPVFRIGPGDALAQCATPPNFPAGISLYQQVYQNWSRELHVDNVWTCAVTSPAQIVSVVNWARANNYKARARGKMHNWSPLMIPQSGACPPNVVLIDTTQLTAVSVNTSSTPKKVTAQTGITMEALLTVLEQNNLGVTATPAPGNLTLGGALAIDGHGTAIQANGETPLSGKTYGSLSNLILSLTAVVWDAANNQYALRTFQRSDPGCTALLTHLGRTIITEVTLQVGTNQRLRCQSWFNVPATEMFATQGSSGRTFASYVYSAGRVEVIWYPFTSNPWIKVWRLSPNKPLLSRQVNGPYNYPFSDNLPQSFFDLAAVIVSSDPSQTPTFGNTQYNITAAGLVTTFSYDIWGWSKNLMLYIKPTTLRVTANGYAVLINRSNIQRAVNEFVTFYQGRMAAYQAQGRYPMNGPVEIRVTGLDKPSDVIGVSGAPSPQLSAVRPRPDHPEWDVAVWFDILTIPGTPYANQFYREIEQWMFSNYSGSYATCRVEWSKGWGYTNSAAWADATMLGTTIPNSYRSGQPVGDNWDTARATLNQFDPHGVFRSPLLTSLLP